MNDIKGLSIAEIRTLQTEAYMKEKNVSINYDVLSKEELVSHHSRLMKALNKIRNHECDIRMRTTPMKLSSEVNKYVPRK